MKVSHIIRNPPPIFLRSSLPQGLSIDWIRVLQEIRFKRGIWDGRGDEKAGPGQPILVLEKMPDSMKKPPKPGNTGLTPVRARERKKESERVRERERKRERERGRLCVRARERTRERERWQPILVLEKMPDSIKQPPTPGNLCLLLYYSRPRVE